MKKRCKMLVGIILFAVFLFVSRKQSQAADGNISVTVPANVNIVFQSDGSNTISAFGINNSSMIPVHVTNIRISECNNWKLVTQDTLIPVDTKQMVLQLNGQPLYAGDNEVYITIAEQTERELDVKVRRGAWNQAYPSEKAFVFEVEYVAGTKQFDVVLDGDGSDFNVPKISAYNGETVTLPTPTKVKYFFQGWKDSEGAMHTGEYVVPIGGAKLTAVWEFATAYALFSPDDGSLTFVRSLTPIVEGSTYDGKTITYVYTGFEDTKYNDGRQVPWYIRDETWSLHVKKVIVKDVIQPKSTSFWFYCMRNCTYYDVTKLDTSKVTHMTAMFSNASDAITDTVEVIGVGKWDVSNVQFFGSAFSGLADKAATLHIDNLCNWNTESATDMGQMFNLTGRRTTNEWLIDCRNWNVDKVTKYNMFNNKIETKVLLPSWVN